MYKSRITFEKRHWSFRLEIEISSSDAITRSFCSIFDSFLTLVGLLATSTLFPFWFCSANSISCSARFKSLFVSTSDCSRDFTKISECFRIGVFTHYWCSFRLWTPHHRVQNRKLHQLGVKTTIMKHSDFFAKSVTVRAVFVSGKDREHWKTCKSCQVRGQLPWSFCSSRRVIFASPKLFWPFQCELNRHIGIDRLSRFYTRNYYCQMPFQRSWKTTIMVVCSRNMACLTKFLIIFAY